VRRRVPPVEFSHGEPPRELLAFIPNGGSWNAGDFAAFLRARTAWRDTHDQLLPHLPARERHRMAQDDIPQALAEAENAAPKALPGWAERAQARRFRPSADTGLLPGVVRPSEADGDMAQGVGR
jgi:hypothetical protein